MTETQAQATETTATTTTTTAPKTVKYYKWTVPPAGYKAQTNVALIVEKVMPIVSGGTNDFSMFLKKFLSDLVEKKEKYGLSEKQEKLLATIEVTYFEAIHGQKWSNPLDDIPF
jgi:hypothetical protein